MADPVAMPGTLPPWELQGQQIQMADAYRQVPRAIGEPRRRRMFRRAPADAPVSMVLTEAQRAAFVAWWRDDLQRGSQPFLAQMLSTSGSTLDTYRAEFLQQPRLEPIAAGASSPVYRATATLRLTPGGFVTVAPDTWSVFDYAPVVGGVASRIASDVTWLEGPDYTGWAAVMRSTERLVSADGQTWSLGPAVTIGGTGFLYEVATDGVRYVMRSGPADYTAGVWAGGWSQNTGMADFSVSIHYVGGLWVRLGFNGTVSTPLAGSPGTWVQRLATPGASSQQFSGVAYGNGRWVAVGRGTTVATSTDGVTWTLGTATGLVGADVTEANRGVRFAGGRFVRWSNTRIYASLDGLDWTLLHDFSVTTSPYHTWFGSLMGMAYADGAWVLIGSSLLGIAHSRDDLVSFTRVLFSPTPAASMTSVAHGNGRWVVMCGSGAGGMQKFWSAPSRITLS